MTLKSAYQLKKDDLNKPDPLALLEEWRSNRPFHSRSISDIWNSETEFITRLRTDPDGVLQELKDKGVWKE